MQKKMRMSVLVMMVSMAWSGVAVAAFITDIVTVNGKDWAQVDLFRGLSWNDMNAVCPGGVCGAGTLNGHDMLGWTWASIDQVNALFNHYIGSPQMGPGPDLYEEYPTPPFYIGDDRFGRAFFADGWRPTYYLDLSGVPNPSTSGRMSDSATNLGGIGQLIGIGASANTDSSTLLSGEVPGGWFQRTDVAVPAPATLALLGLGLVGVGLSRRKR